MRKLVLATLRSLLFSPLLFAEPKEEAARCRRDGTKPICAMMSPVFSLILLIIFAIGFGYFATFNVLTVPILFGTYYSFPAVPFYAVIGISLLIGLILSWFISLAGTLGNSFTLRRKERDLNDKKSTIHTMTKQINQLEIENSNLKGELENEPFDDGSL